MSDVQSANFPTLTDLVFQVNVANWPPGAVGVQAEAQPAWLEAARARAAEVVAQVDRAAEVAREERQPALDALRQQLQRAEADLAQVQQQTEEVEAEVRARSERGDPALDLRLQLEDLRRRPAALGAFLA